MQTRYTFMTALVLAALGCEASVPESDVSSTLPPNSADPELTIRDRISTSYFTTFVRSTDGRRFTDGEAELRILYMNGKPQVDLSIEATDASGESWSARFRVPEATPLETEATWEIASGGRAQSAVQRASGRRLLDSSASGTISMQRVSEPGKHPVLHGNVSTPSASLSAEFRTEYSILCLVPPELIGQESNGHAEDGVGQQLVPDQRFESDFCKKFAALR